MSPNTKPTKVEDNYRARVYQIVRRIPRGRVMTYGQLAELLGDGYTPRTVGFVMHSSDDATPWHRIINAQGACSTGRILLPQDKQQRMLEAEGVVFENGRCSLEKYLWIPKQRTVKQTRPVKGTLFKKTSSSRK